MSNTFNDNLRTAAISLATGEREYVIIPVGFAEMNMNGGKTSPAAYIRTIMSRVKELDGVGVISVKRFEIDGEKYPEVERFDGEEGFMITLNRDKVPTRKRTRAEVREKQHEEITESIKRLCDFLDMVAPNVSDLPEDHKGSIEEALRRFREVARMHVEAELKSRVES